MSTGDFDVCACANADCLRYGCAKRRAPVHRSPPVALNNVLDPDRPWRAMDRLSAALEKLVALLGNADSPMQARSAAPPPDANVEVPGRNPD